MPTDYTNLKKTLGELLQKKQEDKANEEATRQAKNDGDRNKILENISGDLATSLKPVLADLAKNSKLSTDDIRQALAEAIQINMPEVKMPDIPAPVVHIPAPIVNIPAPIVNIPATTFPEYPDFPSSFKIDGVTPKTPLHVQMVDQAGKPMLFPAMSAGGGRADFFTIRDIQTSSGSSWFNDKENAVRITGTVTTSGSVSSTLAQLVNADGTYYSSDNPLPTTATITLPAGQGDAATATRVVIAGNSDASVVVNSGTLTTVTTLTNITNSVSVALVDSSGVAYSGSNPLPTTASISLPFGPGDGATATRFIQAGDTVSSVVVNSGTITTVTTLTGITNSVAALIVDSGGIGYSGSNPFPTNNTQWGGTAVPTGLNETNAGVVRVVQMTDSSASVSATQVGTWNIATLTSITNSVSSALTDSGGVQYSGTNPVPVTLANTGSTLNVNMVGGGNDSAFTFMARTTLPTAVADGADVRPKADKLGRLLTRPIQVRELISTAYATLSTQAETTVLAATAGFFQDLIMVTATNASAAAWKVDFRAVTGGNIIHTMNVPAGTGPIGWAPPTPWPQDATGNNWTATISSGSDVSNANLFISGLFTKEL